MINLILLSLYSFFLSLPILFLLDRLALKINQVETNYKSKQIPIGTGLLLPAFVLLLFPFAGSVIAENQWSVYCLITTSLGIVGFFDDRFGSKNVKGIKGHLLHFIKNKKISTGLLKLTVTLVIGFIISLFKNTHVTIVFFSSFTFAIWTNIFNLLDVRPGRAVKGFWIMFAIIFSLHYHQIQQIEAIFFLLSVILFVVDIRERGMLGDAGSNVLGGLIGYWIVSYSSVLEIILYFGVGALLTLYAEKKSFSIWIEKHPMIQKIDHWGRKVVD